MRQEEHSHLLQSIRDEMVSWGSPGRGNWERECAALCTEAHRHTSSPRDCPQALQGQALTNSYGKCTQASQGLPWQQ